jgi:hypothetical protein
MIDVLGIIGFVLAIVLVVAQLKMFSIHSTLKDILSEVRGSRRDIEHALKMILFELRGGGKNTGE